MIFLFRLYYDKKSSTNKSYYLRKHDLLLTVDRHFFFDFHGDAAIFDDH